MDGWWAPTSRNTRGRSGRMSWLRINRTPRRPVSAAGFPFGRSSTRSATTHAGGFRSCCASIPHRSERPVTIRWHGRTLSVLAGCTTMRSAISLRPGPTSDFSGSLPARSRGQPDGDARNYKPGSATGRHMMKRMMFGTLAAVLAVSASPMVVGSAQSSGGTQAVAKAEYDRWKTELSNWGRWGKDDQIGAVNLITPAKRRQAAALVKEGFSVSLARDVDTEKAVDNPQPYERQMLAIGSDRFGVAFHGVAHTHLDSLAHINYDGVFYNGYKPDADAVMKANGHARNSIVNVKNGIFTRGVLIDIPRMKGVRYLEPGTVITREDVEAFEKFAGLKVTAGDAVFIRTGRWARRATVG